MKKIVVLTAAGVGSRTNQDIPKQFFSIKNKPLIIYTMEVFERHPSIDEILVVCLDGWQEILKAYAKQFNITKLKWIVTGGKSGYQSIKNGIFELKKHCSNDDIILIHDGNRALVTPDIISQGLQCYNRNGSAVAAIPCVEVAFKSNDNGVSSSEEIAREELYRTQTPHIYSLGKLLWAYYEAKKRKIENTAATCSLMNKLNEKIYFFPGSEKNLKITTMDDLEMFKALLNNEKESWIK